MRGVRGELEFRLVRGCDTAASSIHNTAQAMLTASWNVQPTPGCDAAPDAYLSSVIALIGTVIISQAGPQRRSEGSAAFPTARRVSRALAGRRTAVPDPPRPAAAQLVRSSCARKSRRNEECGRRKGAAATGRVQALQDEASGGAITGG